MEYEITNQPAFAELVVALDADEGVRAEAGSLASHSGTVDIKKETEEGLLDALSRSARAEKRPFLATFTANQPGTITLAPPFPGDIFHYELQDEALFTPSSSFLAAELGITFDTAVGDESTFVECGGDFLLELSGSGLVFLSSYGMVSVVSLDPGEQHVVDTGHVVAFEDTVGFSVRRHDGIQSASRGDGGQICKFEGPGTIWTQSRSPAAFLSWLVPNLREY